MRLRTDKEILDLLVVKVAACETRLDSHNRVMESIVRRVRALEGGGGTTSIGEVMHRLTHAERDAREAQEQADGWRFNHGEAVKRAETAERERDEWKSAWQNSPLESERDAAIAKVERLTAWLTERGRWAHDQDCPVNRNYIHDPVKPCTCGLTAALEDA